MAFHLPKTRAMLRRAAAAWFARLQSDRDPDVERKFRRWRDADPRHAEAFDRVSRSYEQAGLLRHIPAAASDVTHPAARAPDWSLRPALAAAAAIAVLVPASVIILRGSLPLGGTNAVMLTTKVGEIRRVALPDGSSVTLDTATRVEVDVGGAHRSAHLSSGRVRFQIARRDEPFVLRTDTTTVSAREAVVDLEQGAQQDRVRVLAGVADVRGTDEDPGSKLTVGAGETVTVNSNRAERNEAVAAGGDWTRGMLQFDQTPLSEAVAQANRYSERPIMVARDLEGLRVTGAFRTGDTAGLARALAAAFSLSLQQNADGTLVLSQRMLPAPRNKRGG